MKGHNPFKEKCKLSLNEKDDSKIFLELGSSEKICECEVCCKKQEN